MISTFSSPNFITRSFICLCPSRLCATVHSFESPRHRPQSFPFGPPAVKLTGRDTTLIQDAVGGRCNGQEPAGRRVGVHCTEPTFIVSTARHRRPPGQGHRCRDCLFELGQLHGSELLQVCCVFSPPPVHLRRCGEVLDVVLTKPVSQMARHCRNHCRRPHPTLYRLVYNPLRLLRLVLLLLVFPMPEVLRKLLRLLRPSQEQPPQVPRQRDDTPELRLPTRAAHEGARLRPLAAHADARARTPSVCRIRNLQEGR